MFVRLIKARKRAKRERTIRQLVGRYADQGRALEFRMHMIGEDVFVAPLEMVTVGDELRTWTSWAEGVPALLPRADFVGVATASQDYLGFLEWEGIERICGPFVREPRWRPARFSPPPWPDADKLDALRDECAQLIVIPALPSPRSPRRRGRPSGYGAPVRGP